MIAPLRAGVLVAALAALIASSSSASEFAHIADDELALEIEARAGDVQRTTARIELLGEQLNEALGAVDEARIELAEIERQLEARVALLYRLSQHGKALRYLFTAESATGFLKRMATLRSLVISGLDQRRRVGLALAESEARVVDLREERRQAIALLEQLETTRQELMDEQQRRLEHALITRR